MTYPLEPRNLLPENINQPYRDQSFQDWMQELYLSIALAVNQKDFIYFPMEITSTAQNIVNLPNYGSYIICVSGTDSTLPTTTCALNKSSDAAAGVINVLGSQVGSAGGAWAGNALTITSTATNFQIAHDNAGVSGNFNVRIIGTQG